MFLTQSGGMIIKPISRLLGAILSLLYTGLENIGVVSIGVSIILFTMIIRMCLFPMLYNQNKNSKITNYIQPEINKATKKFKGKTDQQSVLQQQKIIKEIQGKYGVSMTGGCLTSLIQLPIFFALYRVIQNIPAYVPKIYDLYSKIAVEIQKDPAAFKKLQELGADSSNGTLITVTNSLNVDNANTIIDVLAKFPKDMWTKLMESLSNHGSVVSAINENIDSILKINDFFGIDLTAAPGFHLTLPIIIPILSFVFQFLSMKVTPMQGSDDPTQQSMMNSMKTMMYVMPVFSFFVCVNVPSGLGLYWAVGSLISFLTSIIVNSYFKHCDMEKILEKSMEKAAKKAAKKKKKNKKSFMDKLQEAALGQAPESEHKVSRDVSNASLKNYSSSTMNTNSGAQTKYRAGSLASKANIMQRYNDNNNGGK